MNTRIYFGLRKRILPPSYKAPADVPAFELLDEGIDVIVRVWEETLTLPHQIEVSLENHT
jgi:hypothetical protein